MEGNNSKQTNIPSGTSRAKHSIREENILNGKMPMKLDPCVVNVSKSLCFIQTPNTSGSGFLIKLFKGTQDFFCLMTCEHVIKREMVNQRKTIKFYYNGQKPKLKEIVLNPDERLIQDFRNPNLDEMEYDIDAIVIEILPKDNISEKYFLSPDIRSISNFNKLEGKTIAIIQYPKGELSYDYGEIKEIYKNGHEFSHLVSTDEGSSGSPILLKNSIQVIGGDINKTENYGVFIGPIFEYFQNFKVKKEPWNKYLINKNDIKDNTCIINNNKSVENININIQNDIQNNQLNQMTIIYNIDKNNYSIKIFDENFVNNNKNNCYLIINGEQRELCDY